jgi:DNA-binding response OmpR family regulator
MDGYGKRILVIENDPDGRARLEAELEQAGYAVYTASDGIAGADEIRKRHFDAVIADYHMSGISGLEFADFIKITWPGTPVILISGEVNDVMENADEPDAAARICKPCEPTMLLKALRTVTQPVLTEQVISPMA